MEKQKYRGTEKGKEEGRQGKSFGEEGGIFWEKVVTLQKLMKMRRIE